MSDTVKVEHDHGCLVEMFIIMAIIMMIMHGCA